MSSFDEAALDRVVAVVAEVADAFAVAGHRLYLVGGVVRDLLVGSFAAIDDIDLTTDARPDDIKSLVGPRAGALWAQGERFGTIGATIKGRHVEITTHRAEVYDEASRQPVVSFGTSIDEDLSRRDFTINAMALSLPDRVLLDPFGGLADLERRLLRTPLTPEVSFTDDPLRMLRAARFLPRFELEPATALEEAATALAARLSIVSVERVHDELERLLAVGEPARGLLFLERTGLLGRVIAALGDDPIGAAEAVALAGAPGSPLVRRAGLLLPLATGAADALDTLRYSRHDRSATLDLIETTPIALAPDPSPEQIRTVVARIGLAAVDDLARLCANVDPGGSASFFRALDELAAAEDLGDLDAPVGGGLLIDRLGLEPGPMVGRAVAHLRQVRLARGPMTEEEALAEVAAWLRGGAA